MTYYSDLLSGAVAQRVERWALQVVGSIPARGKAA